MKPCVNFPCNSSASNPAPRTSSPVRSLWLGAVLLALPLGLRAHAGISERIARLEAEIAAQPADALLRIRSAEVRAEHEEWRASLAELDRADELAPGRYATDLLRAPAFIGLGRPAEAKVALDRFLAAHPEHSPALRWRARAQRELGEFEAALTDFRAALDFATQPDQDLMQEAAEVLAQNGHEDEALRILDAGIAKVGATPPLVLRAIDLEVAAGRTDAALARIAAMEKSAPRAEPWMATRAQVLARAGRAADAAAAWQALAARLASLPPAERASHAMNLLAEQAQRALAAPGATFPSSVQLSPSLPALSPP